MRSARRTLVPLPLLLFLSAAPSAIGIAAAADHDATVGARSSPSARITAASVRRQPRAPRGRRNGRLLQEHRTATRAGTAASLPRCTAAQVPRVAAVAGCCGWIGQWAVTRMVVARGGRLLLARKAAAAATAATATSATTMTMTAAELENLHQYAAYTAHTVVALALMAVCSVVGVAGWWCSTTAAAAATPSTTNNNNSNNNRLLETDDAARWLAAVAFGLLAFWDVPVSALVVAALRKPDMVLHHAAMAGIAAFGAWQLPTPYLYFYLGVSELSSLPLLLYSQLGRHQQFLCGGGGGGCEESSAAAVRNLRAAAGVATAASFTAVRVVGFTGVTVARFLRDARRAIRQTTPALPVATVRQLQLVAAASVGFTVLQLYWFYTQIFRVAVWGES